MAHEVCVRLWLVVHHHYGWRDIRPVLRCYDRRSHNTIFQFHALTFRGSSAFVALCAN